MAMITKDFKKYLKRGKGPSRSGSYSKLKAPERKKEQVQSKKNKGSTKAMVDAWGESSNDNSDDEDGDEQALMATGESDEESEVKVKGSSQIWFFHPEQHDRGNRTKRKCSQTSREPVHKPVPQQQSIEGTSRGNRLVVKSYEYQSSHPIENIITDPTSGIKTRSSLENLCAFDAFLSLIEPKNVVDALQDAYWIDVKSAFLNGYLKEKAFVKQPPGVESKESPDLVYKLDKALYGLKQAPRAWYERLSKFLLDHDYKRGKIDNTLFLKEKDF
ncbi:uncharacterized protein [Nicotiana tomentosiformis]|uniref:uncharacterized protein n=1 Tax=Nicotiana tomentosiformis TaxID=4098 RepID=UPI00388C7CCA